MSGDLPHTSRTRSNHFVHLLTEAGGRRRHRGADALPRSCGAAASVRCRQDERRPFAAQPVGCARPGSLHRRTSHGQHTGG